MTGFVGSGKRPSPLNKDEVEPDRRTHGKTSEKPKPKHSFEKGEAVRIIDGPFFNFNGIVEEVNHERGHAQGSGHDFRAFDSGRAGILAGGENLGGNMAKEVIALIKLQIEAGQASPAPPVGPALGQHNVNIMDFVRQFNDKTGKMEPGTDHPCDHHRLQG